VRTLSIRSFLLLFVASVVVPLGGHGAYSIYRDFREASSRAESDAMALARGAAVELERRITDSRRKLEALALWYEEEAPGRDACGLRLADAQALLTEFFAISVVGPNGGLRCTSRPLGHDVDSLPPPPQREWLREVAESRSFVVSGPLLGRFSGQWISVLALPLRNPDGTVEAAIVGSLDTEIFQSLFDNVPLPEGGVVTLAHVDGTVVARSQDPERYVGTRLPPGGLGPEELLAQPGFNRASALEGGDHLWAWHPLPRFEWIVFAGFPIDAVYAPLRRSTLEESLVLAGIFLLVGLLTVYLHRRISGSLELLAADTRTAAEGSGMPVQEQGPREVRQVARQFNESLEARVEAERELRRAEEKLREREKMEAVGRLAGGVAHDFNNLLTVIRGEASLVAEELPEDNPGTRSLEEIVRASERAAELVRQLLTFSGQETLKVASLELGEELQALSGMIRSALGKEIDLELTVDPELGLVRIDRSQLEQLLLHLVMNAREAMPAGGSLRIEAQGLAGSNEEPEILRRSSLSKGPYARIRITDTGEGMTPEVQDRAFEPFFTTKTRQRGTGLGLSTVYGIVSRIGGGVTVESEPEEGTTFTVYLPMEPSAPDREVARGD